jgi:ketosteroid isomerase-like protein
VQGAAPEPDADLAVQREVVDAFLAASRSGDFDALIAVLDPDVVFRIDTDPRRARAPVNGAAAVARRVLSRGTPLASLARPAIVNGTAGLLVAPGDRAFAVVGFTVTGRRIVAIDLVADPEKLRGLALDS